MVQFLILSILPFMTAPPIPLVPPVCPPPTLVTGVLMVGQHKKEQMYLLT